MSRGSPDPTSSENADLPDVLRELRERYAVDTTYSRLWRGIVEGRVPAVRVGKRYQVRRSDYPAIAGILGPQRPTTA